MDLIALHTIQRAKKPGKDATATAKAVPPEIETIKKGEKFTAEKDQAEELIANGAAAEAKADKKAPAKNTKSSSTAAAKEQADKSGEDMV